MEWTALTSTVAGAAIATGSALLLDGRRSRRDRVDRDLQIRRSLYGDYLACLSEARHTCGNVARDPELPLATRRSTARESFGPCIGLRYQMTITAPDDVVAASEHAFRCLRDLRDHVMEGVLTTDEVYLAGRLGYDDALTALRACMRRDLGAAGT
ncbi:MULTISPECIES: hypothetical protein [Streptomyces]|uniref:Secreted protein n=2 Tax=Streptomyces TaxID=1883 RepID=A0ABV9IKQ3_9ACTN